jgi:hypothetical protein
MTQKTKFDQFSEQLLNKGINLSLKEASNAISMNNSKLGEAFLNEIAGTGPCSHTNHSAHSSHSKSK